MADNPGRDAKSFLKKVYGIELAEPIDGYMRERAEAYIQHMRRQRNDWSWRPTTLDVLQKKKPDRGA